MFVEVCFLPRLLRNPAGRTCVVIDVLRASTTLVAAFERGLARAVIAPGPSAARRLGRTLGHDVLLGGEVGGLAPRGFDLGNSPLEYLGIDLAGRTLVFATSNGTRALRRSVGAAEVLVGCLSNVGAVAERILAAGRDVILVCAGRGRGRAFGLDDAFCAGFLVDELARRAEVSPLPAPDIDLPAETPSGRLVLDDSAVAARQVCLGFGRDPLAAFRVSAHGYRLTQLGLGADVEFAARVDISRKVPRLVVRDGRLEVTCEG